MKTGTAVVDMEPGKALTIDDCNKAFEGTKYKAVSVSPSS